MFKLLILELAAIARLSQNNLIANCVKKLWKFERYSKTKSSVFDL